MNDGMRQLLEEVASDAPTPGGGSVSALAGALGAALAAMVWRLTIQKQAGSAEDVAHRVEFDEEPALQSLVREGDRLREELAAGFEKDAESYQAVLAAFRLPKQTEDDKAARRAAIEAAMQFATLVPLQNARLCLEVMDISARAAGEGYQPSVTDAGVGALLGHAGVLGCLYNVHLNLQSVKDEAFAARVGEEAAALRAAAKEKFEAADRLVLGRMETAL